MLSIDLTPTLLSVAGGAVSGGLVSWVLTRRAERRADKAVIAQLISLLRTLESRLIIRRDHDATPVGGYDQAHQLLRQRAYAFEAAIAIGANNAGRFYEALHGFDLALVSLGYSLEMAQVKNNPRYFDYAKRAAAQACEQLSDARRVLGDAAMVDDPVVIESKG